MGSIKINYSCEFWWYAHQNFFGKSLSHLETFYQTIYAYDKSIFWFFDFFTETWVSKYSLRGCIEDIKDNWYTKRNSRYGVNQKNSESRILMIWSPEFFWEEFRSFGNFLHEILYVWPTNILIFGFLHRIVSLKMLCQRLYRE